MSGTNIDQIRALLESSKHISIVTHRNPDGDAFGSSLALYHFLKSENINVTVFSPNDCPSFLKWMPAYEDIVIFEKETEKASEILTKSDIIFTLDFNAFHRTGDKMQHALEKIKSTFIMIDHHQSPDDYAKFRFSNVKKSSTCEMIYDFIEDLNALDKIDENIATCIYTGIMTDTGSFRFPSTTSRTHKIAADLLEKGANNSLIYSQVMDVNSLDRMRLLGVTLQNLKVLDEYKTAYITLSQNELNKYNFEKGDTEGFVNYALSIKGIVFAVIFIEDKMQRIIKMSFRSKGAFSVNEFAKTHFNGGGHNNAAGGRSMISLHKTVNKFLQVLPRYKSDLENSYEI
jgi:phosphoesterase RecJ-like protein